MVRYILLATSCWQQVAAQNTHHERINKYFVIIEKLLSNLMQIQIL